MCALAETTTQNRVWCSIFAVAFLASYDIVFANNVCECVLFGVLCIFGGGQSFCGVFLLFSASVVECVHFGCSMHILQVIVWFEILN